MKKLFLLLAIFCFSASIAIAEEIPFRGPDPGPIIISQCIWKVYVENTFPFGVIEYNRKTRVAYKVISTLELELGQGFVTVVIGSRQKQKLLIPNDRVLYILQSPYFYGWDTSGGTE